MGMFDIIEYEGKCPDCGNKTHSWQSKSGPCVLDILQPWEVGDFYGSCDKCGAWIDCAVDADIVHIVKRVDIKMTVNKKLTSQGRMNVKKSRD